jgi:hypothetical protein
MIITYDRQNIFIVQATGKIWSKLVRASKLVKYL